MKPARSTSDLLLLASPGWALEAKGCCLKFLSRYGGRLSMPLRSCGLRGACVRSLDVVSVIALGLLLPFLFIYVYVYGFPVWSDG